MSGLLSYASPWASDNSDASSTRKRTPTMSVSKNKTIKKMPNLEETQVESASTPQSYNSLHYIQEKNEMRNSRVQEIINNITNLKPEDDGNGLATFAPLPLFSEPKPSSRPEYNHVIIPNSNSNDNNGYVKEKTLGNSYFDAYSKNNIPNHLMHPLQNPKRASDVNGLGGGGGATGQLVDNVYDRMMEKMNKIMYLLEEQQKEPGKHMIEEFILYTFLGVFIIFIVDSFSRSGKYIR